MLLLGGCVLGVGCGGTSGSAPPTTTFRVPFSSMEPTLNCAKPAFGCLGTADDHVLVQPGKPVKRADIVAFRAPFEAEARCGIAGVFIKRVIGLPGETWSERNGYVYINGKKLNEPYVKADRRDTETHGAEKIPKGTYFLMGDSRAMSCDSRVWGPLPQRNIVGPVVKIIHMH